MNHILFIVAISVATFIVSNNTLANRTWTSSGGKQITARLAPQDKDDLRANAEEVTLRTQGGRQIAVNPSQLSAADQAFLQNVETGTKVLFFTAFIIGIIGSLWLIVAAFSESFLWGLGVLFIPVVGLVFAILHWDKGGKPVIVNLYSAALWVPPFIAMLVAAAPA